MINKFYKKKTNKTLKQNKWPNTIIKQLNIHALRNKEKERNQDKNKIPQHTRFENK